MSSELVERTAYMPFGARENDYRTSRWNGFREDYGFTGKEEDVEVGLTYFGKRFLSPQLGRWVTADPLAVHAPGRADFNLYAYVSGALLKAVDPVGLDAASGRWAVSDDAGTEAKINDQQADLGLRISGPGTSNAHPGSGIAPSASPGRMQLDEPSLLKGPVGDYHNAVARNYAEQGYRKFASLVEDGYTCSACHSMFLTNGPPTDEQLDLKRFADVQRPLNALTFGLMAIGAGGQMRGVASAAKGPKLFPNQFPNDQVGPPIQTFSSKQASSKHFTRILNYVVTKEGSLRLGRPNNHQVGGGHIDLAGGEPVQAAGEVKIVGGKIRYIDNSSGHYNPVGPEAQLAAEAAFENAGFSTEGVYVNKIWNGKKWVSQ